MDCDSELRNKNRSGQLPSNPAPPCRCDGRTRGQGLGRCFGVGCRQRPDSLQLGCRIDRCRTDYRCRPRTYRLANIRSKHRIKSRYPAGFTYRDRLGQRWTPVGLAIVLANHRGRHRRSHCSPWCDGCFGQTSGCAASGSGDLVVRLGVGQCPNRIADLDSCQRHSKWNHNPS